MAKNVEKEEIKEKNTANKSNIRDIEIKIEGDTWKKAVDKVFLKKQKTVNVDGFRKGKVPRSIYEKRFGKESLYMDAVNLVIDDAFHEAMEKCDIDPVVQPSVDIKDISDTGVLFVFTVTGKPEIKIGNYKGLNIKPEEVDVTEDEINHELDHLLEAYTELVVKDGKVENGDVAIIDFEGFKDGEAFDGGKGENYSLEIGSNTFIPGFEEKIIGMSIGEEKDLDLTFPEDYGAPDLAGKDVVFKVKVNEIKEKQKRELDEDFFDDLGMDGVDSEEKLREEIKKTIKDEKEAHAEDKLLDELFEAVAKNVEVDVPQEMVDSELERLLKRFEDGLRGQGFSLDLYYHFANTSEEELKSKMEKEAFENVLYRLMLEEISHLEKIEATDEECDKQAEELAKKYDMKKEDFLEEFGGMEVVRYDLIIHKTIDRLKELNK